MIEIKEEKNQVEPVEAPKKVVKTDKKAVENKAAISTKGVIVYKIQILTSNKKLSANSKLFKGYKNIDCFVEKGVYKYTYGEMTDFNEIRKLRRQVVKDFKDAFIVAFKDGKKVKF